MIISSSVAKREMFSRAMSMEVEVKDPEALPDVSLTDVISSSVYINCCFFDEEEASSVVISRLSFALNNFFDSSSAAFSLFRFSLDNLSIIRDAVTLCRTFPESPVLLFVVAAAAAAAA